MIRIQYTTNLLDKDSLRTLEVAGDGLLLSQVKTALQGQIELDGLVFIRQGIVLRDTSFVYAQDEVVAFHYLEMDPATWAAVWSAAVIIFKVVTVAATLYSIYSAIRMSRASRPNYGTSGDGLDASSAVYSWEGIQSTADVGIPVAVVYGEHKIGGNVINAFINSDGDSNFLNLLIGLCEGEIESITDVRINDQPAANFDGVTVYTDRLGGNNDAVIPNFENLNDNYTIGQSLNSLNDSYTYTTAGTEVEGFEVQLSFPQGIFQQNEANGAIEAWSVGLRIEYKAHADSSWITAHDTTVSARQRIDIKRYFRVNGLTPGQYDVRVSRTGAGGDFYHSGDMGFSYLVEIRTQDLQYPNLAKLGLKALATNQLSGAVPNVTCVVKGRKVEIPLIMSGGVEVPWSDYYWDPAEEAYRKFLDDALCSWDGTSWVVRWSANPVWCLRDLLTNARYGLGGHIDTGLIDRDQWHELAKYCDERVDDGAEAYEKRFRMDVVLDSAASAVDVLAQLMTTFRGIIFFAQNSFKLNQDKPALPVQLFGAGNIIAGSLTQAFKSLKETPNTIEIQYLDHNQDYKQNVVSVIDDAAIAAGDPVRKQTVRLYATRTSQALREGRYQLLQQKYITRSIAFRAGIDAVACQPGDVIAVSNDFTQWGYSGRVLAGGSGTSIRLDRTVTLEAGKTYKLQIRQANDQIEERTVTNALGDTSTVTVANTFSQIPAEYAVYAFGETDKNVKLFRVMGSKRANDLECDISAIEYNEGVYDTDAIVLPDSNSSSLSTDIQTVQNLMLTEGVVTLADGTVKNQLEVWFTQPDDSGRALEYRFASARIYLSDDNQDSWKLIAQVGSSGFVYEADLVKGKIYYVRVTSVAGNGMESRFDTAPMDSITITAKDEGPGPVTNFSYTWGDLLQLVWSGNSEADLAGYEIRDSDSDWGTDDAHLVFRGLANKKTLQPSGRSMGTFYIRAYNTSGLYSTAANSLTLVNPAPSAPLGLGHDVFFNMASLYWNDVTDIDIKGYEVWVSETNAWAGEETLAGKTSGRGLQLQGRKPRQGMADSAGATMATDDDLAGLADGYFLGDVIEITAGTGAGQQRTISGFNGTTGEVTVGAAWDTVPDTTSRFIIFDRKYVKVRGYDFYGEGNFSAAETVTFENLDADSIGVTSITPEKILTPCLSALSANMGCLTAGVIQGGCFQTGSGGARTLIDAYGVRSYDANCNMLFSVCNGEFQLATGFSGARVQFNAGGIFGYNSAGNKTLEIKDGCFWGQQLKLEDPACACNYSFLDSGRLKFHDVYGDVPYMTRICSGCVATGGTVCLPGWKTPPQIILSVRELQSYNCSSANSCQKWLIYNDAPVWWCNSPADYGYCFTAHTCLTTTGSVGSEMVKDVAFGVCVCTGANTCSTVVRNRFTLWCNAACANYYAGCLCYSVCYRVLGCNVWCACAYTYLQPSSSTTELCSCQNVTKTLTFPCGACWEIMAAASGLSWVNTGINSGLVSYAGCCRAIGAGNAYKAVSCSITGGGGCSYQLSTTYCSLSLAGSAPANTYCSFICYCYCSVAPHMCALATAMCSNSWGCARGCLGFYADGNTVSACQSGTACAYSNGSYCCCNAGSCNTGLISGCTVVANNIANLCFGAGVCWGVCAMNWGGFSSGAVYACACGCFLGGYLCQCYCVTSGSAGSCCWCNLYTLKDTYATSVILDSAGCLNWLAISYN